VRTDVFPSRDILNSGMLSGHWVRPGQLGRVSLSFD
jgi:hypothetical protein